MTAMTGDQPLPVSVILPTHNRTDVLQRAVRSVLSQTRKPAELIVVDDASSEDVQAALAPFSGLPIRYLRLALQSGPGAARNAGVDAATQPWIAFQDSDDEWLIDKLSRQWSAAHAAPTPPVLVCGSFIVLPRNRPPEVHRPTERMRAGQWDTHSLAAFPFIAPTWLVQRQAFIDAGGFDETLPNLEDWELAFRLKARGDFTALREFVVVKHGSAGGLNAQRAQRLQSLESIMERHSAVLSQDRAVMARLHREVARIHFRLGQSRPGRAALRRALRVDPSAKNMAGYLGGLVGDATFRRMLRFYRAARSAQ